MSRFSDWDDEEDFPGQWALYEANLRRALRGRRGRKFLADLREALLALPEPKLIQGALCTVGADERKAALLEDAEREKAFIDQEYAAKYGPCELDTEIIGELERHVDRDGEGVCAIGAYLWHRQVQAGAGPAEAFASLPLLLGTADGGLNETAKAAEAAGVVRAVAWEFAYLNDETFGSKAPAQRHAAFLELIDKRLAATEAADA